MSIPSASVAAESGAAHAARAPMDGVARALCALLPAGCAVAVAWRDWPLGTGSCVEPLADAGLRRAAELALADAGDDRAAPADAAVCPTTGVDGTAPWYLAWNSTDGSARMAIAVQPQVPAPAWVELAKVLVDATLDANRAQSRIQTLEKSKRLQQALFEIADLAGAHLEMDEMLRRVHAVVGSLMYAENCYIVQYDDAQQTMRFLYFADQQDDYIADPTVTHSEDDMPNSLTFALLRHGQPVRGPSSLVRQRLNVHADHQHGPDSLDWLGVPMMRDDVVCGAIVVQSYDRSASYTDEDRALLGYVAQHILTALDRKYAQVELERRVEQRTQELQLANLELQDEVAERKRAEKLQRALFRIAELAISAETLEHFYAETHAVVNELIDARNFYIALLNENRDGLEFAYSIDEHSAARPPRRLSNGLTEYVIATSKALLVDARNIAELRAQVGLQEFGTKAHSWLGVPLFSDDEVVGAIAVQSYHPDIQFTAHDQRLLAFVAHNIGGGLERQRGQEKLKAAHAQLELRVEQRTGELADVNRKLMAQMGERLRAEQRLRHQANHDALTGLPNRPHLLERLAAAIERARHGDGQPFAVLFLDLDRFKLVNDSIGHAAGDEMLVEVASRIASTLGPDDVVARLGGDEFAIVTGSGAGLPQVRAFADRVLAALARPMWVAGRELFASGSLGIATWHPRYRSGEELLRDADAAMYRAKAKGQDRCAVFDEAMREAAMHSLDLEADLRRAINHNDFLAWYQPIVRLGDASVIGHEALLRWRHERRGILHPADFIALGEDSGLIEQVDWQLYEQVIQQLARGGEGYVSVNVSPRHFRSADFADRLFGMVDAAGADPSRLRVEITEVALLDDAPRTLRTLRALRQRGVLAQLDDFGTGFSALSYLHRFPISALKIDQTFIAGLDGEGSRPESLALVRAILALAGTLGIETIAEGVETEEQARILTDLGCNYGQGYYFGRPAP